MAGLVPIGITPSLCVFVDVCSARHNSNRDKSFEHSNERGDYGNGPTDYGDDDDNLVSLPAGHENAIAFEGD